MVVFSCWVLLLWRRGVCGLWDVVVWFRCIFMLIWCFFEYLVNCIVVGEVVERFVSVLKELIENVIDVGVIRIVVVLVEGGIVCIEVVDDGCGMIFVDMVLVFECYVMLKLFDEFIELVVMLGFCGEVFLLIVSVVWLMIESWVWWSEGWLWIVDNGVVVCEGFVVLLLGMCVVVEDLFVWVLVWWKFLWFVCVEYVVCFDVVCWLVMVWLDIGFIVEYDGCCVFVVM